MENIEYKYSSLTFEFSKLRSRFQSLREYYIKLKKENSNNIELISDLNRIIKRLEIEIDSLEFRNEQFVSRINFLQEELKSNRMTQYSNQHMSLSSTSIMERQSTDETVEFFIETTKSQLANEMIKNDKLVHQIHQLNDNVKLIEKEKNTIIEKLNKENKILKQKLSKKLNISDNDDLLLSTGIFVPVIIDRKTLDNLNTHIHKCLIKLYKTFKPFISNIQNILSKELSLDINIYQLIKFEYKNIINWDDISYKNRIKEIAYHLKPLIITINTIISIINSLKLNINEIDNLNYILSICIKCFINVERFFYSIHNLSNCQLNIVRIENILISICDTINTNSNLIKNHKVNEKHGKELYDNLANIFIEYSTQISDSLSVFKIIIENELHVLRVYGWWPSSFIIQNKKQYSEKNIETLFNNYKESLNKSSEINIQITHHKSNDSILVNDINSEQIINTSLKNQLDEAKLQINELIKEKETLMFNLKANEILSQNMSSSSSSEELNCSKLVNEMKSYLENRIDKYLEDNQILASNLITIESEFKTILSRMNLSEHENYKLKQELNKIKVNLTNTTNEFNSTKQNYQNRLIELTEEVCHFRSINNLHR